MGRSGYTSGQPTIRAEIRWVVIDDTSLRMLPRGRVATVRWADRARLWMSFAQHPYGFTGHTVDGWYVFRSDYRRTAEWIAIAPADWLRLAQKAGAEETAPWVARIILSERQRGMEQAAVLIEPTAPQAAEIIRAAIRAELEETNQP